MKNILLVEDDPNKIKVLTLFFEDNKDRLPRHTLEIQKSYQTAIGSIFSKSFDLILLDMSMHNFEKTLSETGGEFMKFAGEDILKEMAWNEIYTKTIIVTQYDLIGNKSLKELKEKWQAEFSPIYNSTIYYSANENKWKEELLSSINDCLND